MDFETAMESRVTIDEAINEMKRHGFIADYDGEEFFDCESGETIARVGSDGMIAGRAVLAWLGY